MKYLTPIEKIECAYCGYANGLLQYSVEIAGASEKYWCGIKHKQQEGVVPPKHHADFVEYGDKAALEKRYPLPKKDTTASRWQILHNFIDEHLTWRHHHL